MSQSLDQKPEKPVLDMIQQIKDGKLDPRTLDKEERQCCLEVMLQEGLNVPTLAQILKMSDKTIRRDIKDIRLRNSFTPSVDFLKETAGELFAYARIHRDHLMRLARSKEASVMERAQAEMYASQVFLNTVTKLQSIGYLPEQAQTIVGDIFHHNVPDLKTLKEGIHQMEGIIDIDPQSKEKLKQLKNFVNEIKESPKEGHNGNE